MKCVYKNVAIEGVFTITSNNQKSKLLQFIGFYIFLIFLLLNAIESISVNLSM